MNAFQIISLILLIKGFCTRIANVYVNEQFGFKIRELILFKTTTTFILN